MVANEKNRVTPAQHAEHKRILAALLKQEHNKVCADCKSRGPRWASVNLGVFMCLECAGVHRSMGVHVSKVRSTDMDTWLPEQVQFIQVMGNAKANAYWEANLPANFRKPDSCDRSFIEQKYIRGRYRSSEKPPTIERFMRGEMDPPPASQQKPAPAAAHAPPAPSGTVAPMLAAPGGRPAAPRAPPSAAPAPVPTAPVPVDLLGLDDPVPAPAAAPQPPAQAPQAPVSFDAGWDAFAGPVQQQPPSAAPRDGGLDSIGTFAPGAQPAQRPTAGDPFGDLNFTPPTPAPSAATGPPGGALGGLGTAAGANPAAGAFASPAAPQAVPHHTAHHSWNGEAHHAAPAQVGDGLHPSASAQQLGAEPARSKPARSKPTNDDIMALFGPPAAGALAPAAPPATPPYGVPWQQGGSVAGTGGPMVGAAAAGAWQQPGFGGSAAQVGWQQPQARPAAGQQWAPQWQ
ncbi:unnamed protein product [Pedinophyceae sp. YPF-701]|nr:unnamed protein product [Pedinophyceae sp. YPF-701]